MVTLILYLYDMAFFCAIDTQSTWSCISHISISICGCHQSGWDEQWEIAGTLPHNPNSSCRYRNISLWER